MENKNSFNTFNISDLLRAIRNCQKLYENGITCYECTHYKRGICDGKREEGKE